MNYVARLPKIFTLDWVADYFEVSTDTVRREVRRKRLGCTRIGGRLKFTEDQIAAYLQNQGSDPCENSNDPDRQKTSGSRSDRTAKARPGAELGLTTPLDKHAVHRSAQTIFKKPKPD